MTARKIRTNVVAVELETIYEQHGGLEPKRVIAWAKRHPKSALHARFEWDDGKAAHGYRLWQAREMITEVEVEYADGKTRQVYVSPIAARGTSGYVRLVDVLDDDEKRVDFLAQALDEYERTGRKFHDLEELAGVRDAVAEVKGKGKRRRRRAA